MTPTRSILVPIDFSTGAAEALAYAVALRRADPGLAKTRIDAVNAVDLTAWEGEEADPGTAIAIVRRRERRLASFVRTEVGEVPVTTQVVEGDPRAVLPEVAAAYDLVIVGATGATHAEVLAPGGVAEALVRRSPVPVITVKWATSFGAPKPDKPLALRAIVVATDLTEFSAPAIGKALSLGFTLGASVTAVHVAANPKAAGPMGRLPFSLSEWIDRFYERELGWQRDELGRFVRDRLGADRPVEVREVLRAGHAAEEIIRECEERGAGLLLLSTHGRSGIRRAFLGSVAERALRFAPCPVMTVRPGLVAAPAAATPSGNPAVASAEAG